MRTQKYIISHNGFGVFIFFILRHFIPLQTSVFALWFTRLKVWGRQNYLKCFRKNFLMSTKAAFI